MGLAPARRRAVGARTAALVAAPRALRRVSRVRGVDRGHDTLHPRDAARAPVALARPGSQAGPAARSQAARRCGDRGRRGGCGRGCRRPRRAPAATRPCRRRPGRPRSPIFRPCPRSRRLPSRRSTSDPGRRGACGIGARQRPVNSAVGGGRRPPRTCLEATQEHQEPMSETATEANVGKVVEIKGVVVDAVFPDRLPAIYNALRIRCRRRTAARRSISSPRCSSISGDDTVRAVAMDSTDGIPRGADVRRHRRADHGARRRADAGPAVQRARRHDRQA